MSSSSFTLPTPSHRGNPNTFISQLRKRFPNWGIIYPSYCSRDAYFGKGEVGLDGQRFGYVALIQALKYVDDKYGIKEMFVGGTSAGGLGASVIARDLKKDMPDLKLLGAIIDSGPAEGQAYATLKDEGGVNGFRQIVVDEKGTKAWIHCKEPLQDTRRGLMAINFLGFSFSKAIEEGRVSVPLFHAWQSRDNTISCGDLSYARQFLDGALARAITRYNPGGLSVNYEKCEGTTPACAQKDPPVSIEQCAPENIVQGPCSRHGVVGGGPNVNDVLRWMETVIEQSKAQAGLFQSR